MDTEKKSSIYPAPGGTGPSAAKPAGGRKFPSGGGSSFYERLAEAGYITGRRYDAVKNAFLSYKTPGSRPKRIRTRITRSGETFGAGRKIVGKLCVVGGYLRLFLALDPKNYNQDKYHHKDYSEVLRYAKFPFMIKLSSERQVRYAEELIDDVMLGAGFERDPDYASCDQAQIFGKAKRSAPASSSLRIGAGSAADETAAAISTDLFGDTSEDTAEEAAAGTAEETAENAASDIVDPDQIWVKLPVKAAVLDKYGDRIGKVRDSVWYDLEGYEQGRFSKEEDNVFLYSDGVKSGYLDGNNNIISVSNRYVATLKRFDPRWLFAMLALLLIVTVFTTVMCILLINRSSSPDYAPVLFVATEGGEKWGLSEEIPVFYNEVFGDSVVAPGMTGSYRFKFENQNPDPLLYSLTFTEENEYGISVAYRLKRDGAYICGSDGYVPVADISIEDMTIEALSDSVFELEWTWMHNDDIDTLAGESGACYVLRITLEAQLDMR